MIAIVSNALNIYVRDLVAAAFRRSISSNLVRITTPEAILDKDFDVVVCINPDDYLANMIIEAFENKNSKIIIFGNMPKRCAKYLRLYEVEIASEQLEGFDCAPAKKNNFSESSAKIKYTDLAKKIISRKLEDRPLCRYDFESEWNNIGYGAIKRDGSIWAVSSFLNASPENVVAQIKFIDGAYVTFAGLFEAMDSSLLWINRSVGLIDSGEWILIEKFISSWGHKQRPCIPVITEIPFGYDSLVSMRLDCDEDLHSARSLWGLYRENSVPFSIAVHTEILSDRKNVELLQEMAKSGVGIMSHSSTHAPNWGGSYERAINEARDSRDLIESIIDKKIYYAVSPFHQTPHYALQALCDVGYRGCIGGIICSDPEFLIGRGGQLANIPNGFIGHSQQCMMHGDCLLDGDDLLQNFKQSFDFARDTRTAFGYLDHPISKRYDYAWKDEERRIQIHKDFLEYIQKKSARVCFMSEIELLDYFIYKSSIEISKQNNAFYVSKVSSRVKVDQYPSVEFKSNNYELSNHGVFQ